MKTIIRLSIVVILLVCGSFNPAVAQDLKNLEGPVFVADILGAYWLYDLSPLPGAAPWNYGALDGLAADPLLLPDREQ